jgi:hypothetical protein
MKSMQNIVRGARRLFLLLPVTIAFGSALAAPAPSYSPRGAWVGTRPVDFETLDSGLHGPWTKPALILIRNPTEWHDAMEKAGAMLPVHPPQVDWSQNAVVLAVLGEQPILGYDIEVTEVLRHAQDLLLRVNIELPDGPNPTQNFTTPYHLIQVPAWRSMTVKADYNAVVPDLESDVVRPRRHLAGTSSGAGTDAGGSSVNRTTWGALKDLFR